MLLELDRTKPIDFRMGQNRWGHRLHASTFAAEPNPRMSWLDWFRHMGKTPKNIRRVSFLCHSAQTPAIGRQVTWTSPTGDRTGTIYDIEYQSGVHDMYKLFVELVG